MAELKQQDKSLWQKICDWFKDLLADLKAVTDAYKGFKPDSPEGRMVAEMDGVITMLEGLYTEALLEASENAQAAGAEKSTIKDGEVKMMVRENTEIPYQQYRKLLNKTAIKDSRKYFAKVKDARIEQYRTLAEKDIPDIDFLEIAEYNKVDEGYVYTIRNYDKFSFAIIGRRKIRTKYDGYVMEVASNGDTGETTGKGNDGKGSQHEGHETGNRLHGDQGAIQGDAGRGQETENTDQKRSVGYSDGDNGRRELDNSAETPVSAEGMEVDAKTEAAAAGAEKNTAQEGDVKYSLRAFEKDGRRFVEIDQEQDRFDGHSNDEYPGIAKEIIKEKFENKVVGIDNKMFVNGAGRSEYAYPSKPITDASIYEAKMRASPELDNLLDAGTNFRNEADGRDGHIHPDAIGGFDYFDTLFKIGNRYFEGRINIKNVKRGKLFTDVTQIKDVTQAIMSSYGNNPKSQFLRTSSMNSIRNPEADVKEKLSLRDAEAETKQSGLDHAYESPVSKPDTGNVKYALGAYSQQQKKNWETSKRIVVCENVEQLRQFVKDAIANKTMDKKLYLGAINEGLAKTIHSSTGINVEGYNLSLGSYEIRKILKDHGDSNTEASRGQRAVTPDDFEHISKVILNPISIALSKDSYMGKPAIIFTGEHNGRMNVVAVVSDKRLDLFVQTVYVNRKKGNLATPIGDQAPINTPEASNGTVSSTNSIRNDSEDVKGKMSLRDPEVEKAAEAVRRENEKLKEDVTRLRELLKLQRQVTGGTKFTKTSVEAAARYLKQAAVSKGDTAELAKLLNSFYENIAQSKELSWEDVREQALPAARWLMEHKTVESGRTEYAEDILKELRSSRISLDESQKGEAAYRWGSFNDFRKAAVGTVTVSKDGVPLDEKWQEWAAMYPGVFDANISATDMPGALMDTVASLRSAYLSRVEAAYQADMIEQDLLRQVYDSYWRVSTLRTVADRMQKQINALKSVHYTKMDELRSTHREEAENLRKEHRERLQQMKAERRQALEKQQKEASARYQESRKRAAEGRERTAMRHKIRNVVNELNQYLLKGTKERHVPIELQKAVAEALDAVNMDTVGAEERIASLEQELLKAKTTEKIRKMEKWLSREG